ncbi:MULTISPECIES: helix-turn-helix transcriptional regulator [unclassified Streptomyces]|uniref:helix-turn-helix domain-containing protein n=1 Tax=unclassified Streptomyces TaxID=2593676 RepID=UPI003402E7CF
MALRTHISERQRRLGSELRRLREEGGATTSEAAAVAGFSAPFLSNIESARTAITTDRLRRLCAHYRVTPSPYVEALVKLAESNGKGWWTAYRDRVTPYALNLAELEAGSADICSYQPLLVPGLLQTEAYIRALFDDVQPRHATAEDAVAFRLERQKILTAEDAPTVRAVIHEAALRMHYGGPEVMRSQLLHLIELARLPNVSIQVFPFRARTYPGVSSPFLLTTPHVEELATVVLDHPAKPIYRDAEEHLSQFRCLFGRLRDSALAPLDPRTPPESYAVPDSLTLIQHLLHDL